jgi:hypothetical protein
MVARPLQEDAARLDRDESALRPRHPESERPFVQKSLACILEHTKRSGSVGIRAIAPLRSKSKVGSAPENYDRPLNSPDDPPSQPD